MYTVFKREYLVLKNLFSNSILHAYHPLKEEEKKKENMQTLKFHFQTPPVFIKKEGKREREAIKKKKKRVNIICKINETTRESLLLKHFSLYFWEGSSHKKCMR